MASPKPTPEASELRRRGRQRLIGAVVLVLLLVVFVPMLLDSEPHPARDTPSTTIPPRDKVQPLPAPVAAPPAVATDAAKPEAAKPDAPKVAAAVVAPIPARDTPVAKEAAPARPAAAAASTPPLEGFVVQVGAFRDEAKLKQARSKLEAAGVPHYTERLDSKAGALTRLRAGPFATREQAEAAQAAIRRAALEGKVMSLP